MQSSREIKLCTTNAQEKMLSPLSLKYTGPNFFQGSNKLCMAKKMTFRDSFGGRSHFMNEFDRF
jgi:hypothetical protein